MPTDLPFLLAVLVAVESLPVFIITVAVGMTVVVIVSLAKSDAACRLS